MFWVPLKIALSLQVKQTIKIHLTTVILLLMYARGSCMRVFARSKPWYLQITALYSCWYGHFCLLKPNKSVFIFSLSSVCFWEHKERNENKYIIKNKRPAQQHTNLKDIAILPRLKHAFDSWRSLVAYHLNTSFFFCVHSRKNTFDKNQRKQCRINTARKENMPEWRLKFERQRRHNWMTHNAFFCSSTHLSLQSLLAIKNAQLVRFFFVVGWLFASAKYWAYVLIFLFFIPCAFVCCMHPKSVVFCHVMRARYSEMEFAEIEQVHICAQCKPNALQWAEEEKNVVHSVNLLLHKIKINTRINKVERPKMERISFEIGVGLYVHDIRWHFACLLHLLPKFVIHLPFT